jgi:hypothetical protein
MKPLNLDNKPCSPISSNCVIWQGPDIPCIKLCTGDTVSDVIAKLATELCAVLDTLNVTNYDLSCFNLVACGPNDFQALIQFLIERICALQTEVALIADPATSNTTRSTGAETLVTVAPCFVVNGVTVMTVSQYAQAIGTTVCSLINQITILQNQITSLDARVTALEAVPAPTFTLPSFEVNCTLDDGVIVGGNTYTIDQILEALVNDSVYGYCALLSSTGLPADLLSAVATQCISNTDDSLANPGQNMSTAYFGTWITSPVTIADAVTNLWVSVCDMRSYVSALAISVQNTSSITLSNTANVITANINDTGWVNLQGFAFYQGGMASSLPQCRRIGNQIHFRGTVYVPLADGAGTSVQPLTATDTYRTINRGLAYIGSGGMIADAQGRILFNSNGANAQSVIPSSVLTAGTVVDNQYVHNVPFLTRQLAVEQKLGDGQFGTVLLTAYGKIELLTNGTLRITGLNALETNSSDNVPMIGTSLFTNITSNFIGRSRVIDWATNLGTKDGTMSTTATPLINDALIIGRLYTIISYAAGDNFTNVGAVSNLAGQSFIATGTTPTTWTNGSRLIQVTDNWILNQEYANFAPAYLGSQFPLISDTTNTGINAAKATELGGFVFDLDGLTVFVDKCTTDIKPYIPC